MKEERYHIALDDYEHGVVIRALNDSKTELMHEGMLRTRTKPTGAGSLRPMAATALSRTRSFCSASSNTSPGPAGGGARTM